MLLSTSAFAADKENDENSGTRRPKVGVVLSGGGAKGIAHVGVLKVLEELKIPVDYVTGTSIGSIIGGLYALGYTPDEMQELIINTDWNEMMKDHMSRQQRLYEFIERDDRLLVDVPVMNGRNVVEEAEKGKAKGDENKGGLSHIPLALVEGQNLNSLFTQLSVGYQDDIDFNKLPIPFACVAVDLTSRKPVILRKGNIVDAMRSSMAIPGYFAPVKKKDMMLVDGGMLNNLPVDVARQMGADIIIAVDLHHYDKSNKKKPDNLGDMFSAVLKILNGEKYQASIKNADICITPNTEAYGILDFTPASLKALADSGYFAALEQIQSLEKISSIEKDYWNKPPKKRKHAINLQQDSVQVGQISISGANPKDVEYLMNRCRKYVGDNVTGPELDTLVKTLYNTRAFSKVAYSVINIPGDSSYILKMKFTPEKVHSVGLGLRFDTEEIVAALINVSINRHRLRGWKAELDANLSYNPVISLSGGYAFSEKWQLNLGLQFRRSDFTNYENGQRNDAMTLYCYKVDIYQQRKGINSDLRFIHRYDNIRILHPTINTFTNNLSLGVQFNYDNRDKGYFATEGIRLRAGGYYTYLAKSNVGDSNHPYGATNIDIIGTISCGEHFAIIPSFMTRMKMGIKKDESIYSLPNTAGGYEFGRYTDDQMPFVGANFLYHLDNLAAIARVDLRGKFGKSHYVYLRGNVLGHSPKFSTIGKEGGINMGYGIGYELDSFFGPIGVNVHWSDLARKWGFYLSAGFSF